MRHPNFSEIIIPIAGTHASRRLVDWVTGPKARQIEHLIEESRLDAHALVTPFQTEQSLLSEIPLLDAIASEIASEDKKRITDEIFKHLLDGEFDSTKMCRIKKILEQHDIEAAILQRLDNWIKNGKLL